VRVRPGGTHAPHHSASPRPAAPGARAGRNAADWWDQDTLGGRASGDTDARATLILAGNDDLAPLIVDALPACDVSGQWADAPTEAGLYHDAAPAHAPGCNDLDPQARDEAIAAYRDRYDSAAHDRVAEHCRRTLGADDQT